MSENNILYDDTISFFIKRNEFNKLKRKKEYIKEIQQKDGKIKALLGDINILSEDIAYMRKQITDNEKEKQEIVPLMYRWEKTINRLSSDGVILVKGNNIMYKGENISI